MAFGQVSGRLLYKGSKTGKCCTVTLSTHGQKDAEALYAITTPYPGRFHFAEVLTGKYKVEAYWSEKPSAAGHGAGKAFASGQGGLIDVKERQHVENISITLEDS